MGGSGGGGRYTGGPSLTNLKRLQAAQERERENLNTDIENLLKDLLTRINDRDREEISERIDSIKDALGDKAELDAILFGGSVAKHTDVDGVSDVDALVILNRNDLGAMSPKDVLHEFHKTLKINLSMIDIKDIKMGRLAVTIQYTNGEEIQLLPALRSGKSIKIGSPDGNGWSETKPGIFQRALIRSNASMNGTLVPAVKLVKSAIAGLPAQKQLSGYHVEALAVDAVQSYTGPKTTRALVLHILDHATSRVLSSIQDVTGQSRNVDLDLGVNNSIQRRNISMALGGMKRRLAAARSVGQWKAIFQD